MLRKMNSEEMLRWRMTQPRISFAQAQKQVAASLSGSTVKARDASSVTTSPVRPAPNLSLAAS